MKQTFQPTSLVLLLIATPALAPVCTAQLARQVPLTEAQGAFSTWALGLSRATGTTAAPSSELLVRAPGAAPAFWTQAQFGPPTVHHPNYSPTALTANWFGATQVGKDNPDFGGTSTGGDVTPVVDSNGVLQLMGGTTWYALNISVKYKDTPMGVDQSLIRSRWSSSPTGSTVGRDIFSFYAPYGAGIHQALPNTVRIEATAPQLGVTADITNIDYGMGVISVDVDNRSGLIFPIRNRFYFTLTPRWLNANPGFRVRESPSVPTMIVGSPATIYVMEWNGASWLAPVVAYGRQELFPTEFTATAENPTLAIDAISVYQTNGVPAGVGVNDRVVFSLQKDARKLNTLEPYDQILVYQRPVGTSITTLTTPLKALTPFPSGSGTVDIPTNVSTHFGLRSAFGGDPDDVDGTCGIDPHREALTAPYLDPIVGLPSSQLPNGSGNLGFSAIRTNSPQMDEDPLGMTDRLHLQVTGLGLQGYPLGLLVFYEEIPPSSGSVDGASVPLGGAFTVDPVMSNYNAFDYSSAALPPQSGDASRRFSATLFGVSLSPFQIVPLKRSWFLNVVY